MTRFANPKAAQAMMQTHGHTNLGMPPKPGPRDIGTGAPPFNPNNPRAAVLPRGAIAVNTQQRQVSPKPPPPGMTGLGSAVKNNPKMAQNLGKLGSGVAKSMGMKKGGAVKKAASAKTSAKTMASRRGDGCAVRGKTKAGIK